MTTFVVAHGAWSAGWAWKKMHLLMRALGHTLITPTYTGIGERSHLAHAGIDLDTHITDILNVLEFEDLRDVILIGHSYGGMVATGVADRAVERIARLVYLDAFVPRHGDSLLSLTSADNPRPDMLSLHAKQHVICDRRVCIPNRRYSKDSRNSAAKPEPRTCPLLVSLSQTGVKSPCASSGLASRWALRPCWPSPWWTATVCLRAPPIA